MRILGIPILFDDRNTNILLFQKASDIIPTVNRDSLTPKEAFFQAKSFIVNLDLSFSEQTIVYQFFSMGDIVGKLGGLLATYNSILASYGVIKIVMYVYNFASMTKRKDQEKIRRMEID